MRALSSSSCAWISSSGSGGGVYLHHAARVHQQAVAVTEPHCMRQIQQDLPDPIRAQQQPPTMSPVELDQHAIELAGFIPGAGRQDCFGAQQGLLSDLDPTGDRWAAVPVDKKQHVPSRGRNVGILGHFGSDVPAISRHDSRSTKRCPLSKEWVVTPFLSSVIQRSVPACGEPMLRVSPSVPLIGRIDHRTRTTEQIGRAEDLQPHLLFRVGRLERHRMAAFRIAAGRDNPRIRQQQRGGVVQPRQLPSPSGARFGRGIELRPGGRNTGSSSCLSEPPLTKTVWSGSSTRLGACAPEPWARRLIGRLLRLQVNDADGRSHGSCRLSAARRRKPSPVGPVPAAGSRLPTDCAAPARADGDRHGGTATGAASKMQGRRRSDRPCRRRKRLGRPPTETGGRRAAGRTPVRNAGVQLPSAANRSRWSAHPSPPFASSPLVARCVHRRA